MTILERYIFRRALIYSASSLASLVLIVWIVQALSRIDIVKTSVSAAGNIVWIALMLLPNLTAGVVPFAVLIGAVQALNALNQDSERAVISASGASQFVVTKPIFFLGCLGGLIMLLIANVVGPAASSAFQNGIRSINADTITLFLQPGRFERIEDGLVLSVAGVNGNTISGLVISDTRDETTELTYFAREAHIVDENGQSLLLLNDGQLHRRNVKTGAVSVIEFQSYAFDLAALRPSNNGSWIRTSERSTLELLNPDPNDPIYQDNPLKYVAELTDRLTGWLFAVAFALWAVVVAGEPVTNRQGTGYGMMYGLVGGLVLKAAGFLTLSLIDGNELWVVATLALPVSAIALNLFLISRHFSPSQSSLFNGLTRFLDAISRAFARRTGTLSTYGGSGGQ